MKDWQFSSSPEREGGASDEGSVLLRSPLQDRSKTVNAKPPAPKKTPDGGLPEEVNRVVAWWRFLRNFRHQTPAVKACTFVVVAVVFGGLGIRYGLGAAEKGPEGPALDSTVTTRSHPTGPIQIRSIRSTAPDRVILKNTSQDSVEVTGYILREGDNDYRLPAGCVIGPESELRIWCVRPGVGLQEQTVHDLVNLEFRIKAGETISLVDRNGKVVHERLAD